jgi:6-phosphogluconolactonase (cycloisomerase 2 family)
VLNLTLTGTINNTTGAETCSLSGSACGQTLSANCNVSSGIPAYVANSTGTGFTVYTVNTDGTLTRASISPQSTPAAPIDLVFTSNGKWAYFLDEGGQNIWAYTRAGDGSLATQIDHYPVPGASAIALAPSGSFLYVALPKVLNGELVIYSIDPATGILSQQASSTVQVGYPIDQLSIASSGGVLYGLSKKAQTVVSWTLTSSNGNATQSTATPVGLSPSWMVLSPNGSYLYVLDSQGTTSRPTPNNLNPTGTCSTTAPDPTFCSPNIYGFTTAGNGLLTQMAGSPFNENYDLRTNTFPANPAGGVVTNDNKYLFVVNQGSNQISAFQINSTTNPGEPVEVPGSVSSVNGVQTSTASPFPCGPGCNAPSFAAASGTDNGLYVIDQTDGKIFQFSIDQNTGRLLPQTPAFVPAESATSSPVWITIY